MTLIVVLAALGVVLGVSIFVVFCQYPEKASSLYDASLRQSMFTGFLSLGGFLLSMKTFILVNIKKGIYESDVYLRRVKHAKDAGEKVDQYGPLFELQNALSFATAFAIFVSLLQFTIGLLPWWIAKATAASMAVLAFSFVAWAFWLVYMNTKRWFELMEEEEKEKSKGNPLSKS